MAKNNSPTPLTGRCATCGTKIQRNGARAPWKHERPTPSGAPHGHSAVPKKK